MQSLNQPVLFSNNLLRPLPGSALHKSKNELRHVQWKKKQTREANKRSKQKQKGKDGKN